MALQVDPRADCFLIWTGNSKREAVSVEGSQGKKVSLQWICFVGEQSKNQAAPIEDGVGVLLTSKDYLLTSDAEIGVRIGVKPLAAYILNLEGICRKRLISLRGPRQVEVAIDCRLRPGKKATITCAVKNADPARATGFRPALEAVRAPAVTGEVHFQLLVNVKAKR